MRIPEDEETIPLSHTVLEDPDEMEEEVRRRKGKGKAQSPDLAGDEKPQAIFDVGDSDGEEDHPRR
jgi:hypothetical protein